MMVFGRAKRIVLRLAPKHGISRASTLERLARESPHLHTAVAAGELSANAAAIQAGLRKKPSAFAQVKRLVPKLTPMERRELMALLR
jgi:hypothetical protein